MPCPVAIATPKQSQTTKEQMELGFSTLECGSWLLCSYMCRWSPTLGMQPLENHSYILLWFNGSIFNDLQPASYQTCCLVTVVIPESCISLKASDDQIHRIECTTTCSNEVGSSKWNQIPYMNYWTIQCIKYMKNSQVHNSMVHGVISKCLPHACW